MSVLTRHLSTAFVAAATALHDQGDSYAPVGSSAAWLPLRKKLEQATRLAQLPLAAAFDKAIERAVTRFQRECSDSHLAAATLALLSADAPDAHIFRQIAIEELVLSAHANTGRLLDWYRRQVRITVQCYATPLPSWSTLAPAISLFLGSLLPQALAEQHGLRPMLPDALERDLLDDVRMHTPGQESPLPLAMLLSDQRVIAAGSGTIAHVHQTQTVVQGDFYAAPSQPVPDLAALYRRYCTFLIETFGMLDFRGMMQVQHAMKVPLEDVYVPLTGQGTLLSREQPLAATHWHVPAPPERWSMVSGATAPLHTFLRDTPCLVILGGPGAGKSTLIRYILLSLARGHARHQPGLHTDWLPIFFPIAAFAEARRERRRRDLAPLDYLGEYYEGLSQPDYTPLFQRALVMGTAMVLLDGLDEVRTDRGELIHCLEAFVREWDAPGNRFVATSRIAGYVDAPLDEQVFTRVTILPLSDAEIEHFIMRWIRAYESTGEPTGAERSPDAIRELQRRTELHARTLSDAVFANPDVTDLARNPLLLTILALIHNQGARLPDRRVDLYRLCVEALAETWNRARSLSGREIDVYLGDEKLDERFVVNLLGPAALWIHGEQPGGLVDQRDLERHLTATLIQTDGLPRGRAQRLARSFIELMRRDTGLLQERGYQRFGFLHLTFEEYLAARGLLESVTVADPDALIHTYCTDPRWREVLRLAIASAPQREAQRLLLHLLAAPTTVEGRGRPVVLAGECLLDIGRNSATQRAWSAVVERLVTLLDDAGVPLTTRVDGGHVLGHLGDPRLPEMPNGQASAGAYWCTITAGPFWFSSDRAAEGGNAAQATLRQIPLPYSFRLARFPVTNAEYAHFVAAGGYSKRRWWTPEGWAFLRPGGHRSPLDHQDQPITHPGLWGEAQFNRPAQPVVGVSWYEAVAYCTWLTAQGHRAGWLPADNCLRLPTSLEWERAARHIDQRRYPWGDDAPTIEHANYEATRLRAPAPVGCFPIGSAVCGAQDLAGNVWEWTTTLWEGVLENEPCEDVRLSERPVIRGGAFNWEADYLACSTRYWFHPGHRYNLLGFRVAWADEKREI